MTSMISEDQIRYIAQHYPESQGDNTFMCLGVWKEACKQRGIPWPDGLDEVIKDYKPEAVVRKRRYVFPPTDQQLEKEAEYYAEYRPHHC